MHLLAFHLYKLANMASSSLDRTGTGPCTRFLLCSVIRHHPCCLFTGRPRTRDSRRVRLCQLWSHRPSSRSLLELLLSQYNYTSSYRNVGILSPCSREVEGRVEDTGSRELVCHLTQMPLRLSRSVFCKSSHGRTWTKT